MDAAQIREAVQSLFKKGDETIIDYICGVLEDEHFEFGDDGEEAYESIGPFLVGWTHRGGKAWPHARRILGLACMDPPPSCVDSTCASCMHADGWRLLQQ